MLDAVGVGIMLDAVVTSLAHVGLKFNASKTKVLTTQAQTPSTLKTPAGVQAKKLIVEQRTHVLAVFRPWKPLSSDNTTSTYINYRLQRASWAFQVQKRILCDKKVSIALRLQFFNTMVTSVVCFAAGGCYDDVWLGLQMSMGICHGTKFCTA